MPKKFVRLVFCLFALSVFVQAKSDWTEVKSKNFILIGNAGEKTIRKVGLRLEQYRETLRLLFPRANLEREVPTVVYVFISHDSFRQYKPRYKGKIQENVAGYIMQRPEQMYIAVTKEERGGLTPFQAIFHEYYHYVLDNNLDNAPPWLNEGLAEFYSTFDMDEDGKNFRIGSPIARHFYSFRNRSLMPLEKLLTTGYGKEFNDSNKDNIFYAESWAFVHYLMLGNDGKRQAQFFKFINALNSGVSMADNFKAAFGTDFKGMDRELDQYTRRLSFPVNNYTASSAIAFEDSMKSREMSDADVQLQLGRLSMNLGERDAAEKSLRKAFNLEPESEAANLWLGYFCLTGENFAEAEKLLNHAVELGRDDYLAHTFKAYLSATQKNKQGAILEYNKAIELQPRMARVQANLASFQSSIGEDENAFTSYGKAMGLNPREPAYYYSSSIVGLRLHHGLAASAQAQSWLRIRGWDKDSSAYAALVAYFGYRVDKQNIAAEKILQISADKLDSTIWAYSIVRYLQKGITAEELLKMAASDKDKLTEAHCYIGLNLITNDQKADALPHFQWVKENGNKDFIEYGFALAEMKRAGA